MISRDTKDALYFISWVFDPRFFVCLFYQFYFLPVLFDQASLFEATRGDFIWFSSLFSLVADPCALFVATVEEAPDAMDAEADPPLMVALVCFMYCCLTSLNTFRNLSRLPNSWWLRWNHSLITLSEIKIRRLFNV